MTPEADISIATGSAGQSLGPSPGFSLRPSGSTAPVSPNPAIRLFALENPSDTSGVPTRRKNGRRRANNARRSTRSHPSIVSPAPAPIASAIVDCLLREETSPGWSTGQPESKGARRDPLADRIPIAAHTSPALRPRVKNMGRTNPSRHLARIRTGSGTQGRGDDRLNWGPGRRSGGGGRIVPAAADPTQSRIPLLPRQSGP